jgi:hypothetical protein
LEASEDLKDLMPLTKESYISLNKDSVQVLDQFLFRFSKLQDAIGRKLFKKILILKEDDVLVVESMPFLDILNTFEKLSVLETKTWQRLRDIRNELAYNYDEETEEMAEVLNEIHRQKDALFDILNNLQNYYKRLI